MYCSSEWIVIIGVPLSINKDVEMSNCYVCKVDKFIEWFTFGYIIYMIIKNFFILIIYF